MFSTTSIDGLPKKTIGIHQTGVNVDNIKLQVDKQIPETTTQYQITNASISGNNLTIRFVTSGCDLPESKIHIYASHLITEVYPPEVSAKLVLDELGLCTMQIEKTITVDLSALQYQNNPSGKGVFNIYLEGWDKTLTYNY